MPRLHDPQILIVTTLGLPVTEGKPFETETRVGSFDEERPHGNILGWYGMTLISMTGSMRKRSCGKMKWSFDCITDVIPRAVTVLGPLGNVL